MTPDCIWIVTPPGYLHSAAFDETALALNGAFADLGHVVPIVRDATEVRGVPLVLGANLLVDLPVAQHPERMVLYNLEQVQPGSPWMRPGYIELLARHDVWDYSTDNIAALGALGVRGVRHCPIAYHPALTRIRPAEESIDVLFIGSLNERRSALLHQLVLHGLDVKALFGVYGVERDRMIARSRILLNVHFYEAKVLELVRLSYWLANERFIVSEPGSDPGVRGELELGVAFAPYGELVATCLRYARRPQERRAIARRGAQLFRLRDAADVLRTVLTEPSTGRTPRASTT